MDKKNILAFVLIGVILLAWMAYTSTTERKIDTEPKDSTATSQTFSEKTDKAENSDLDTDETPDLTPGEKAQVVENDSLVNIDRFGRYFAQFTDGSKDFVRIETELIKATVSNKGFTLLRWELKNYKTWNGFPTQFVWDDEGELFMTFLSIDGKRIDTRDLYFEYDNLENRNITLKGDQTFTLSAKLEVEPGKYIMKSFTFYGNRYHVQTDIDLHEMGSVIPSRGYDFKWANGIRYQERNSVDESSETMAIVSRNGEIDEFDASDIDEPIDESLTGMIDFVGLKVKYFGVGIIPQPYQSFDGTVDVSGFAKSAKNQGMVRRYSTSVRVPYDGGNSSTSFQVFMGPLDYKVVEEYQLTEMVSFGWRILIRPIGEYFMMPIFQLIHKYIANYGIAIILFSLIMKLLLYPLSIQQVRSASKMKLLAPEIARLREKYKDDNAKQQKATMALYSEYGINPAAGCLPLLLQMPILYALWSVLRTAIDLRQADFIWWITDLSLPDSIVHFGGSIMGISSISGLALAMGITMFFQQKLTITDPKQKAMVYMMPIMFTLMFSNFPSGLNLYYFIFNLLGIGQQIYVNKFSRNKLTLEDLARMPKKQGWLQKKMAQAQEVAESKGKSVPGKESSSPKKYTKKKRKK
jgi:YidC/Oxa1 family membrane protein insertase